MEVDKNTTPRKRGGWKAIPYVMGNEAFEKLASMSLIANLTVFLAKKYNLEGIFLINVVNIWSGSSNIVTLVGAFISDAYLGRFLTIFYGSIFSLLGLGIMTFSAGIPRLRPPACHFSDCQQPEKWQLGILFTGLGFMAAGSGCLRPCNVGFGADQFDTTTKKGQTELQRFFNYWFLSFTLALLVALTAVVYIQTNVSWFIGFLIPTVCIAISIVIFLMGCRIYVYKKPGRSVFVDIAKVMVASFKKRHVKVGPGDDVVLYDPPLIGDRELESSPKMRHTDRFKWLDKAAVVVNSNEINPLGLPKSNWQLCSVHQVEQLKCLVGIIPVWFTGIGCFIAMDQQDSFGMLQAMQLDTSAGRHFKIPPAWMTILAMLSLAICIITYEQIYVPKLSKFVNKGARLTTTQRIKAGIIMSILSMVAAGITEKQRRETALEKGTFKSPLSIAILVPQFVFSGLVNAFSGVALMEFYTMQIPESMRSVSGSVFFLSLSISSYLSSLIVNVIHVLTGKNGKTPWLGGHDLNKNRLDYFYYIIAALGLVNFAYFTFFAKRYVNSSYVYDEAVSRSDLENIGEPPKDEEIDTADRGNAA